LGTKTCTKYATQETRLIYLKTMQSPGFLNWASAFNTGAAIMDFKTPERE
jgi:hypothetical protein